MEQEMEMEMEMEMDDECEGTDVSYANDLVPIINKACALSGCHVEGFRNGDFTSFTDFKARADNGTLESRVVGMSMPPASSTGPSLTDEEIMMFKCWIDAGAQNN